jgi:hypothetical protein
MLSILAPSGFMEPELLVPDHIGSPRVGDRCASGIPRLGIPEHPQIARRVDSIGAGQGDRAADAAALWQPGAAAACGAVIGTGRCHQVR